MLQGATGTGKTHLAAAIANVLREGPDRLLRHDPDLLDYLRSAFAPGSKMSYDKLFEVVRTRASWFLTTSAHSTSPWAQEKLFQV